MNAAEFNQQYCDEQRELVVRISWCWDKKSGGFSQIDGLYHAKARFDQALDVATGRIIGKGAFNWLEWLTRKKMFGFPYGFKFESGHLYRVLVRPGRDNDENSDSITACTYYVDKLLESDVRLPELDPLVQFSAGYQPEEHEATLLIESGPRGWAHGLGFRSCSVRYLAIAEGPEAPTETRSRLKWMEPDSGARPSTQFDDLTCCRAIVRHGINNPSDLMLVRVLKKVTDPRFDAAKEAYLRPVVIHDRLGEFTLDRHYDWFEGQFDYLGTPCSVLLNVDDGSEDASVQLERLRALHAQLLLEDDRVREFAADELLENAIDWCEEELSRKEFKRRMSPSSINIGVDGSVEFSFNDGDMFAGHWIVVSMEADGTLTDAVIEG